MSPGNVHTHTRTFAWNRAYQSCCFCVCVYLHFHSYVWSFFLYVFAHYICVWLTLRTVCMHRCLHTDVFVYPCVCSHLHVSYVPVHVSECAHACGCAVACMCACLSVCTCLSICVCYVNYLASSFCSITRARPHTCAHTQRRKDRNRFCSVWTFHSIPEFWREWDLFPLCSGNDPSGLNKTSLNSQPPYSSFPSLPCLNKLFTRNSTGCLPSQSAAESACQSSLRVTTTARLVSGHARKSTTSRLTDCMTDWLTGLLTGGLIASFITGLLGYRLTEKVVYRLNCRVWNWFTDWMTGLLTGLLIACFVTDWLDYWFTDWVSALLTSLLPDWLAGLLTEKLVFWVVYCVFNFSGVEKY